MKNINRAKYSSQKSSLDEQIQTIVYEHTIYTTTNLKGIITRASFAFCERSGYTQEELLGRTHSLMRAPETLDSLYDDLWETIEDNRIWSGEIQNIAKNGISFWIRCIIRPLFNNSGEKIGYIALRDNITREKEIEAHSYIDEVTQVYNRRKLNQDILVALEQYERYGTTFALVMLDIDHFKAFNDRYGHLLGDKILIQVSAFIDSQTRLSDIFARWGGDEFALLIQNINSEQAAKMCEKLRQTFAEQVCTTLQNRFNIEEHISCSFGVTSVQPEDTIDSLLGRTDRALYMAKEKGRDCVEIL